MSIKKYPEKKMRLISSINPDNGSKFTSVTIIVIKKDVYINNKGIKLVKKHIYFYNSSIKLESKQIFPKLFCFCGFKHAKTIDFFLKV